jgi:hypothetical protein
MKKITTVFCLLTVSIFFVACGGNDYPEKDKSIVPQESINDVGATMDSGGVVVDQPVNINALPAATITTNAGITPPTKAKANIAGLNPAHGEPGHRCDISVGAPLNSPATTSSAQPVQTITSSAPVAAPVTGGLNTGSPNPAHGEPGHDCSIAVGAPLKN